MSILIWIRYILGSVFLISGVLLFIIEVVSIFKLSYVLNRMHAAATGDTLGLGLSLIGLMLFSGLNMVSLKLFLILLFLWFSSPVSSHLISRLEVEIHEEEDQYDKEEK